MGSKAVEKILLIFLGATLASGYWLNHGERKAEEKNNECEMKLELQRSEFLYWNARHREHNLNLIEEIHKMQRGEL